MSKDRRNVLNWDGGNDPYYWSPSKEESGLVLVGCGVAFVVLMAALVIGKLAGLLA